MFEPLKYTHLVVVTLFFLTYLIKTILLMTNKLEKLNKYSAKTKVPEMIISFLFLITGVWMLFLKPEINSMYYVKFVVVVLSIPLAVKGFKQYKKGLGLLSFVLIVVAYGMGEMIPKMEQKRTEVADGQTFDGKALFLSSNCVTCHGEDGKAQLMESPDLTLSKLTDAQKKEIITNGKGTMASYKGVFSEEEIDRIVEYLNSIKTNE